MFKYLFTYCRRIFTKHRKTIGILRHSDRYLSKQDCMRKATDDVVQKDLHISNSTSTASVLIYTK